MYRRLLVLPSTQRVNDVPFAVDRIVQLFLFMASVTEQKDHISSACREDGRTYGSSKEDGSGLPASRASIASIMYSPTSQSSASRSE